MEREFHSGEIVPVSGIYRMGTYPALVGSMREITLIRGRRFPASLEGGSVSFELIYRDEVRRKHRSSKGRQGPQGHARPEPKTKMASNRELARRFIAQQLFAPFVQLFHSRAGA